MRSLNEIVRDNKEASKIVAAPRNLHNGANAELVESVSGKDRKKPDAQRLVETI